MDVSDSPGLSEEPAAEEAANLPLSDLHKCVERCIGKLTGQVRHAGRNAFHHLRRAWALRTIDPEMAVFRAITAEEEAATSLILSVKNKNYPNANLLLHRDHTHKASIFPFLLAVNSIFVRLNIPPPKIGLDEASNPPRLTVAISANALAGIPSDDGPQIVPVNPLDLVISDVHGVLNFHEEMQGITKGANAKGILKSLRSEANLRNRLLYAGPSGFGRLAKWDDAIILQRLKRVTAILILTIAVEQTPEHQGLVVQAIDALTKLLAKTQGEPIDWERVAPKGQRPTLTIERSAKGDSEISLSYPFVLPNAARLLQVMEIYVDPSSVLPPDRSAAERARQHDFTPCVNQNHRKRK